MPSKRKPSSKINKSTLPDSDLASESKVDQNTSKRVVLSPIINPASNPSKLPNPISTSNPSNLKKPISYSLPQITDLTMADKSSAPITIYQLALEDDGSPSKEKSYIRLPAPYEPYALRILIAAGARSSKAASLFTNFPLDQSEFDRSKFHEKPLPSDTSKPIQVDLPITKAGVFEFYFEYDDTSDSDQKRRVKSRSGYFNVDPILSVASRKSILKTSQDHSVQVLPFGQTGETIDRNAPLVNLPLDGLVIQTVIAKWMGTLKNWPPYLDLIRDRGYDMIHFTPLQQRGESGSPYSIFDQLRFDPELFETQSSSAEKEKEELSTWLSRIRDEWGILSMTDVVWNHTAHNSLWLRDHPESGYNVLNSPHLEPALELDSALLALSSQLANKGLPVELKSSSDLDQIMKAIEHELMPQLKLWEYYVLDVDQLGTQFQEAWNSTQSSNNPSSNWAQHVDAYALEAACLPSSDEKGQGGWRAVTGPRSHATQKLNLKAAVDFFHSKGLKECDPTVPELFRRFLQELNVDRYREYDNDLITILGNIKNRLQYTRLDEGGPRMGPFNEKYPLIETLFTRLEVNETTKKHDPRSLALANNGWIWNANPLEDFASPSSKAYLRREVIVWGDCVKLRYGKGEHDNPFLWKKMKDYTTLLASLFHGFRIDNCHSTPIHVGEALLDVARRVRPDLYVCAELFTGSEEMDTYFVSRLGINSLIREAMNGHDPKDQSRLLYNYGLGKPLGSMDTDVLTEQSTVVDSSTGQSKPCQIVPLHGSRPHAFLMDCTHDNESPSKKRTARDAISTGALVAFSYAAVGSNKGFDDLYPELLDLVKEKRMYEKVSVDHGIGSWKRILNHLHTEMVLEGYKEGHFHQENDYIISHRVHPSTLQGYLLVAHTAFHGDGSDRGHVEPMRLRGTKAQFVLGSTLEVVSHKDSSDDKTLKGLGSKLIPIEAKDTDIICLGSDDEGSYVDIKVPSKFPPGSVMLFSTWMEGMKVEGEGGATKSLESLMKSGAEQAFGNLSILDLNVLLFRTDGEERDMSGGKDGIYNVPGLHPALTYCGLEGWMFGLRHVIRSNDLGHPLCAHLRDGPWAFDYVVGRLKNHLEYFPNLDKPVKWFEERVKLIKDSVPAFLRPKYFALLIYAAYRAGRSRVIDQCSEFVKNGTDFVHTLAMSAIQMYGVVQSSSLDPSKLVGSVAAGLPHFSSGWARTWGRDCGISASGLFVKTGLWEPARAHILCFCTTLKHGLMPNLLDSVRTPRYNSRDAPWFILQLLQDYVKHSKEGESFLDVEISRRFPKSDEWVSWDDEKAYKEKMKVIEVVEEVLERHANGIHFREYNAGPAIDCQMKDAGFNIDIEVDWNSGLIHGGNEFNCGTWMDKMGESEKAGNKGVPGTSRDGAPVEITGLIYSTLRWMEKLSDAGKVKNNGVEITKNGTKTVTKYRDWANLIQSNFEKKYYVPLDPEEDSKYEVEPNLVTRRGIYKDVYGTPSERAHADYQLRPNFPIAMVVAPDLFDRDHAHEALKTAKQALMGPLGMKTLDPKESDYRPNYDNSNDSHDWHVAKGRNYHQGPEWVWPVGYFLRAYLHFDLKDQKERGETIHEIHSMLAAHRKHLIHDPWAGLPELTNENGNHCKDSCESQAWSTSTLLDALFDIYEEQKKLLA